MSYEKQSIVTVLKPVWKVVDTILNVYVIALVVGIIWGLAV